jgi:hypothetical protein
MHIGVAVSCVDPVSDEKVFEQDLQTDADKDHTADDPSVSPGNPANRPP